MNIKFRSENQCKRLTFYKRRFKAQDYNSLPRPSTQSLSSYDFFTFVQHHFYTTIAHSFYLTGKKEKCI